MRFVVTDDQINDRTIGLSRKHNRRGISFVESRIADFVTHFLSSKRGRDYVDLPTMGFSLASPVSLYISYQDDLDEILDRGGLEQVIRSIESSCHKSRDEIIRLLRIWVLPPSPPGFVAGDLRVQGNKGVFDELGFKRFSARTPVVESMNVLKSSQAKAVVVVQHHGMFQAIFTPEFSREISVIAIGPGDYFMSMAGILLARKIASRLQIPILILANQSTGGLLLFSIVYWGDELLRRVHENAMPVGWIPWGKKIRTDKPLFVIRDRGAPELRRMIKGGVFTGLETEELAFEIANSGQMVELEAMCAYGGIPKSRDLLRRAVAAAVRRCSREGSGRQ